MRYVPTSCLREGMILGENLYGETGDLLLSATTVLKREYIASIERLKYNGVYIDDDISKDIPIINMISDSLKAKTIRGVKDFFLMSEEPDEVDDYLKNKNKKNKEKKQEGLNGIKGQVENIVDEIFENQNLMVNMIDLKIFDDYTYFHSVNVAVLSVVLGTALELDKDDLFHLGMAALFHDIGKVFVDKNILNKKGKLTVEEFQEVQRHSELGAAHLDSEYGVSIRTYRGILDHHERFDSNGYPNSIGEEKISLYGRIITLADVYDALTSDRPYRRAMHPGDAVEYIMASTGTLFDPALVELFVKKVAPYPVGTCVELSNQMAGIVLENYESFSLRPRLRIFMDRGEEIEPYIVDLFDPDYLNVVVTRIV